MGRVKVQYGTKRMFWCPHYMHRVCEGEKIACFESVKAKGYAQSLGKERWDGSANYVKMREG